MKTAILTIALALASVLSALAQTVMRENSTVYFKTNVFLHDNPTNPLHQRISVEGQEPLWVAASNQVVYYQSSEMTNASIHARYLYSTNATLSNANIHAEVLLADVLNLTTGMTFTASTVSSYTNTIAATGLGNHLEIKAGDGSYPNVSGGDLLLTPGTSGGVHSQVIVTRGRFEADIIKTEKIYITDADAPAFSSWLQSDGTNLFFVSTVPPGFTNALTTNAP